jgi:hypothetical protein
VVMIARFEISWHLCSDKMTYDLFSLLSAGEWWRCVGWESSNNHVMNYIPSGYLTVCHGKSPFLIGKPSIFMGHLYHGYVSHNQRVIY